MADGSGARVAAMPATTTTTTAQQRRVAASKRGPLRALLARSGGTAHDALQAQQHQQQQTTTRPLDLGQGLLRLYERGALPHDFDAERLLACEHGPMHATRATLRARPRVNVNSDDDTAASRARRPVYRVMTATSGFAVGGNYKMDYAEIERLPAKLNVTELQRWEADEAAEAAAAAAAAALQHQQQERAQASSSTRRDHDTTTTTTTTTTSSSSSSSLLDEAGDATALAAALAQRDDPRTYTELLDLYSMHEFIIRKGATLRNTPEFASFKRHYAAAWGAIESLLQTLEGFLRSYGVELAYVDGKRVAALAAAQPGQRLLRERDLLACIANTEDVAPLLGNTSHQYYYGSHGHHRAAAKLQATWRMHRQRIAYAHLRVGTHAATVIQRAWALHRAHAATRRALHALHERQLVRWRHTQDAFVRDWPHIRDAARTVVHLPSLSYPSAHARRVPFYTAQQAAQLMRLCDLADANVHVVLVAPFRPEPEVLAYYTALLRDAGVRNVDGRLTLLVPEDAARLPSSGVSLTRVVLLCARLLKLLAALTGGPRPAYIVPGVVGLEERALAMRLNVPLLAAEPRVALALGSKSGAQRLLEAAEVATPVGVTHLRSRGEVLRALATLMLEHRGIPRWLVKLETEACSRGHAYFDVSRIRALRQMPAPTTTATAATTAATTSSSGEGTSRHHVVVDDADADEASRRAAALLDSVLRELTEHGDKRVRLVHPSCYASWSVYLDVLDVVGATIEAVPAKVLGSVTANLFLEPSGEVHLESVAEPLLSPAYTVMGCCFPCRALDVAVPYAAVREAALSVGRAAVRKRIMGYVSVDFVVFEKPPSSSSTATTTGAVVAASSSSSSHRDSRAAPSGARVRLWGVDVDLHLTNNAAAHRLAAMLTHATWDASRGTCTTRVPRLRSSSSHNNNNNNNNSSDGSSATAPLCYVYSGLIYNPFIGAVHHTAFFALCRARGIAYDREQRVGVVFQLVDVLLRGCVGALSLGTDMTRVVRRAAEFQSLLNLELPKQGEHSAQSNFVYFSAIVRQLARVEHHDSSSSEHARTTHKDDDGDGTT